MHDPEDEHDPVVVEPVVHDPVLADPKSVERVIRPTDRLDRLAAALTWCGNLHGEPLEGAPQALSDVRFEPLERPSGGWAEGNPVRRQGRSARFVA